MKDFFAQIDGVWRAVFLKHVVKDEDGFWAIVCLDAEEPTKETRVDEVVMRLPENGEMTVDETDGTYLVQTTEDGVYEKVSWETVVDMSEEEQDNIMTCVPHPLWLGAKEEKEATKWWSEEQKETWSQISAYIDLCLTTLLYTSYSIGARVCKPKTETDLEFNRKGLTRRDKPKVAIELSAFCRFVTSLESEASISITISPEERGENKEEKSKAEIGPLTLRWTT